MKVTLIGCGCGTESMSAKALNAVAGADLLVGAPRLLAWFPEAKKKVPALTAQEIILAIRNENAEEICVMFSGDSGFYSGVRRLLPLLEDCECRILPGISSLQIFASRLGEAWQDWRLCSAHGTDCDPVAEVCRGKKVFFLTGGKLGAAELCRLLTETGLGGLRVTVGENLGTEEENIFCASASELAEMQFSALSVMLAEAAPRTEYRVPGLPDSIFERAEKIPMTKQEIRATALAKLAVGPEDVCWDIGAGTGSMSVELALQAKTVWGVEQREEALQLARRNREKLGAWNLRLIAGSAPESLSELPKPDAVFIGGSDGRMKDILQAVHSANPAARICVSAVALESLQSAVNKLRELEYTVEISQIAVSRSRAVGGLTMMTAQNPVYLILGRPE